MFQEINPLDKSTAVFEITIMLLVAALFGFFIGWLIQKFNQDKLKAEVRYEKDKYDTLHANFLKSEKEQREFSNQIKDLRKRKDELLKELEDLKEDNIFINNKLNSVNSTEKHSIDLADLETKISSLSKLNDTLMKDLESISIKEFEINTLQNEIKSLKNKNDELVAFYSQQNTSSDEINLPEISLMRLQLSELANDKQRIEVELKHYIAVNQTLKDSNQLLLEREKDHKVLSNELNAIKLNISDKLKASNEQHLSVEDYKQKRERLIKNVGKVSESNKNVLSNINGIGPLIEAKLNSIGIYTFEQISSLTSEDIEIVTDLIEFFPGRIERDNWVSQSKSILG